MFAGRYLWWLITSTALLLLVLFGFDGVAYFTVGISDCVHNSGSCYILSTWLLSTLKPMLAFVVGMVMVICVLIRILYLRFNPLWVVPVAVWAMAVSNALGNYVPLWHGATDFVALSMALPPAFYAFSALTLFLVFPLEEEDVPVRGQAAPMGAVAGFAGFVCTMQVFATASSLPAFLARSLHMPAVADVVAQGQKVMSTFMLLNEGTSIPGLAMVALFALALALRIVRHEQLTAGTA